MVLGPGKYDALCTEYDYEGERIDGRCIVRVIEKDRRRRRLRPRLDLYNHSPTGFEWGYGGSGPAQLALALLADTLGDGERAVRLHQFFKRRVVADLPHHQWRMSRAAIVIVAAKLEKLERASR